MLPVTEKWHCVLRALLKNTSGMDVLASPSLIKHRDAPCFARQFAIYFISNWKVI